MKSVQAIWRFISTSWLVAAPLVIVVLLVVGLALLGIAHAIIGSVFGAETADNFLADTMAWAAMVFVLALLLGLPIYAIFCLARWLVRKKER
jgi:preprotein translocase subunit SecG